jgi:hypothetical protein
VAERPLLSERGGRAKEARHCFHLALKREIVRRRIVRSRTPCDDTVGLCDVDRVWQEARCSNLGGGGEPAPIVEQRTPVMSVGCWIGMASRNARDDQDLRGRRRIAHGRAAIP